MKVQFRNIRLKRLPMEDKKKIVLIAGKASHGRKDHEHNAGCLLLEKCLDENMPAVHATVYRNGWPRERNVCDGDGWPRDPTVFDNADAIVLYMDGGRGHPINGHLEEVDRVMKRGVGLACLHFAVEVPKGRPGNYFLDWIGGYFETHWSVNPFWTADCKEFPEHPITRGVEPFKLEDEWYYHMRFRDGMEGVTPVLSAIPPASTVDRPDGPRSSNPQVRAKKGEPQHLAWARERPGGGRGFGFTGGHYHANWANDSFRKLVLNGIVWVAGAEVPAGGVPSATPTAEELEANLDPKR
jgi:type 1 glutamine amidotransferase